MHMISKAKSILNKLLLLKHIYYWLVYLFYCFIYFIANILKDKDSEGSWETLAWALSNKTQLSGEKS